MDSDDVEGWLIGEGILQEDGTYDGGTDLVDDCLTLEEMAQESAASMTADAAIEHYEFLLATVGPGNKRTICSRMKCFLTQCVASENLVDAFHNDLPRLQSLCRSDERLLIAYEIELLRLLILSFGRRGDGQIIDSFADECLQRYKRARGTLGARQRKDLTNRLACLCTLPRILLEGRQWAPEAFELCLPELRASASATAVLVAVLRSAGGLKQDGSDSQGAFRHNVERWLLELSTDNRFMRDAIQKEISDALTELGLLREGQAQQLSELATLSEPASLRLLGDTDVRAWPAIVEAARARIALPESGYELMDGSGVVIGMAELAWPAARRALLLPEQSEFTAAFDRQGWETLMLPLPDDSVCVFVHKVRTAS